MVVVFPRVLLENFLPNSKNMEQIQTIRHGNCKEYIYKHLTAYHLEVSPALDNGSITSQQQTGRSEHYRESTFSGVLIQRL